MLERQRSCGVRWTRKGQAEDSALASCSSQNKFQDCYYRFQGIAFPTAILSCRPCPTVCAHMITVIFFLVNMYSFIHFRSSCFQEETQASSFLTISSPKLQWQGPSFSHPLPRTFGIYHVIFHPFPLCLLSGRDSSIIFFRVPSPVFPLHPLTSRFHRRSHRIAWNKLAEDIKCATTTTLFKKKLKTFLYKSVY